MTGINSRLNKLERQLGEKQQGGHTIWELLDGSLDPTGYTMADYTPASEEAFNSTVRD
jgi:hypothetical protein